MNTPTVKEHVRKQRLFRRCHHPDPSTRRGLPPGRVRRCLPMIFQAPLKGSRAYLAAWDQLLQGKPDDPGVTIETL
ncbi:hypothetical protein E2C01_081666 [Portunus trituberculatus]|uniref:Uncharacterized protein n=1 Tax=Portunus trituberculatus TaxID=210409 RepID=A0A5B7IQD4_PORTR|nr:hypothetical protein [Portunus trituberculatus]